MKYHSNEVSYMYLLKQLKISVNSDSGFLFVLRGGSCDAAKLIAVGSTKIGGIFAAV